MALWQYRFHLLPKKSVQTLSLDHLLKEDEGYFDDEPYWQLEPVNKNFFIKISKILPRNKSWSKEIDLYGNQDSNCFEVLFENSIAISVSFRIDFRSDYELILRELIEFSISNDFIILDENLSVLKLNFEHVKSIIEISPQMNLYDKLSK